MARKAKSEVSRDYHINPTILNPEIWITPDGILNKSTGEKLSPAIIIVQLPDGTTIDMAKLVDSYIN